MGKERRHHYRFPVTLTGTLEIQDEGAGNLAFGVQLTDVSSEGIGITCGGALPRGASVRLCLNGGVLHGFVAHCRAENGHYSAGIRVDQDAGVLCTIQWIANLSPAAHVWSRIPPA
jgi:hypothetical protein